MVQYNPVSHERAEIVLIMCLHCCSQHSCEDAGRLSQQQATPEQLAEAKAQGPSPSLGAAARGKTC